MRDDIASRVMTLAQHILASQDTVRDTALLFGVSKSTVHKDVSDRLRHIDLHLYEQVKKILEFNKSERHIRGGTATKQKYSTKALIKKH